MFAHCCTLLENIGNFCKKWNFPNCVGAIDAKHIRIKCPPRASSTFFNYKDFHPIVLLAIVDANYKNVALDVGSYGRERDAGIFLKSVMGRLINSDNFNITPPAALLLMNLWNFFYKPLFTYPDSLTLLLRCAFALTTSMMKPFPRLQSLYDKTKTIYIQLSA